MHPDSLTFRTLKNLSYNVLGYGLPVIFAFFVTPIIVFHLGTRDYGVYIFINTIASLLGLLDLGISTATQKYIAEYSVTAVRDDLKDMLGSVNTLFLGMGTVGLAIMATMGLVGCQYFNCTADTTFSYPLLFVIAGGIFFVESLNSLYGLVPFALQRFDVSTKIGIAKMTFQQLTIVALVLGGFSLYAILLSTLAYSVIFSFVQRSAARRILPEARLFFRFKLGQVKKLYAFGLSIVINNLSTSSLVHFDRFLIPLMLGPSKLTYYSLPGTISSKVPGLVGSVTAVIFPVATHIQNIGTREQLETLYLRSLRLVTIAAAAFSVPICIFAYPFLRYWLDETFAHESSMILMIFAGTAFLLSLQSHATNFLYGLGKLKAITTISAVMAIINILLLALLLPIYGITGAAWAYVISLLPVFYLSYYIEKKYLTLRGVRARYALLYGKLAITSLVLFSIAHILLMPLATSLYRVMIILPGSVLLYVGLYWVFGFFMREDVEMLRSFGSVIIRRIIPSRPQAD
ncbi:MAG: hypothetical protein JWN49_364 [Parcubacteria group bacterium]|nr:hypothetical protein [Parcubacteria group bacterium]